MAGSLGERYNRITKSEPDDNYDLTDRGGRPGPSYDYDDEDDQRPKGIVKRNRTLPNNKPPYKTSQAPKNRAQNTRAGSNSQASGKKKSKFAFFYIVLLLAAVAVCMVIVMMAIEARRNNTRSIMTPLVSPQATPMAVADGRDIQRLIGGVIAAIDYYSELREIIVIDSSTGRTSRYNTLESTEIKDRFGTVRSFAELTVGQVVDISFDTRTMNLATIMENTSARELRNRTNVAINLEDSTLTIGNDTYTFSSQTIVLYNEEPYPIVQIDPIDSISLTVHNNKVWCVRLEASHGFLRVDNIDEIVGGTLAIGRSRILDLSELQGRLPLIEGTHRIIVEGENIEIFEFDVVIRHNETSTIDLNNVVLRSATLRVTTNEIEFNLIVGGVEQPFDQLVQLPFGEHTVRVEKNGFIPVEQLVTISQNHTDIHINMEAIVLKGHLTIYSNPANVEVFIGGVFAGYTPLTTELDLGMHSITGVRAGYQTQILEIRVDEGENSIMMMLNQETTDPFANLPSISDSIQGDNPNNNVVNPPPPPPNDANDGGTFTQDPLDTGNPSNYEDPPEHQETYDPPEEDMPFIEEDTLFLPNPLP